MEALPQLPDPSNSSLESRFAERSYGDILVTGDGITQLGDTHHHHHGNTYNIEQAQFQTKPGSEEEEIAEWLASQVYIDNHNDAFARVQPGTGQWFLRSDKFSQWVSATGLNLVLEGIPGCGKTCLASIVVDELRRRYQNDDNTIVLCFYNSYKQHHLQTTSALLATLVRQTFLHNTQRASLVQEMFRFHRSNARKSRPSASELGGCLRSMFDQYSRIFIVIDALDECMSSEHDHFSHRHMFLQHLATLQDITSSATSILVTTRPFHGSLPIEFEKISIKAVEEDIATYVRDCLQNSNKLMFRRADICTKVENAIAATCDGMFLLARIQTDLVVQQSKPSAVLKLIDNVSKTSNALNTVYTDTLSRIRQGHQKDLAGRALSCLVQAKGPLAVPALRHAVAIERGMGSIDDDDLDEMQDILAACSGLVVVDKASDTIRLVHHTTYEFFRSTDDEWFGSYRNYLAKACLFYLSMTALESYALTFREELHSIGGLVNYSRFVADMTARYPFVFYALKNWYDHLRLDSKRESWPFLTGFFQNRFLLELSLNKIGVSSDNAPLISINDGALSSLGFGPQWFHVCAYLGATELLDECVRYYIQQYWPITERDARWKIAHGQDSTGNVPMIYAAAGGQFVMLEALLRWGELSIDQQNKYVGEACYHALRLDQMPVVTWLLNQISTVNRLDERVFDYLLHAAVRDGRSYHIRQLLNLHGAKLLWTKEFSNTLLFSQDLEVVDSILSAMESSATGSSDAFKKCLSQLVDNAFYSDDRAWPLYSDSAAFESSTFSSRVIIHLVSKYSSHTSTLCFGNEHTLLTQACAFLNFAVMNFLLADKSVDFTLADARGFTPLMRFVNSLLLVHQHLTLEIRTLLQKICERGSVNYQNPNDGMTALHIVASAQAAHKAKQLDTHPEEKIADILVSNGARKDIPDQKGRTALDIMQMEVSNGEFDDYLSVGTETDGEPLSSDEEEDGDGGGDGGDIADGSDATDADDTDEEDPHRWGRVLSRLAQTSIRT